MSARVGAGVGVGEGVGGGAGVGLGEGPGATGLSEPPLDPLLQPANANAKASVLKLIRLITDPPYLFSHMEDH